jgi:hypothetical protein
MATSVIKSGFVAVVLLWASPSTAQMKLDYSGLLAPQLGYINSNFALAPLSHIPFPEWNTPELVLQLRMLLSFVVGDGSSTLVASAPA